MNADIQWTCHELINALIEGGAQGALIVGLIWVCLKLCPRANAATQHGAWFATLLVVALLPAAIFVGSLANRFLPAQSSETLVISDPPVGPSYEEAPVPEELIVEQLPLAAAPDEVPPIIEAPKETGFHWVIALPGKVAVGLVACWLVLATIRLGVLAAQLVILRRIKKSALPAPEILDEQFQAVVASMGLRRNPRLLISDKPIAPMVVGFLHPAMLLPRYITEQCTSAQIEHLCRHELAHLARRDDWTNLMQQCVAAILFFHPGILFVSRRLTAEREIACDDHALAISRAPREYALFLTEFASQMKGRDFNAAPAAWSNKSQLKERIGMILNGKRNASPRVSRAGVGAIAATAATLGIAALMITPRFVIAAEEPEAPIAPVAPEALPAAPATSAAPAALAAPAIEVAITTEPLTVTAVHPEVSIASVTTVAPKPVRIEPMKPMRPIAPKIAMGQPEPEPRPRIKRVDREDGDVERRIERLEKTVDELRDLLKRDRHDRQGADGAFNKNFNNNFRGQDFNAEMRTQMDQARREIDRAHRDAERAVREQKMALQNQFGAGQQQWTANRESLKARRQALEAQRKQIEKELQAVEKEMEKNDADREKRAADKDREKQDKEKEKVEKKMRDKSDSDDDERKAK